MSELKDCPFCGGEATTYKVGRDWHRLSINHSPDCIIEDLTVDYAQTNEQLEMLIDDWNTRNSIPISKLEELKEDLKDSLIEIPKGNGKSVCKLTIANLQKLINEAKQ